MNCHSLQNFYAYSPYGEATTLGPDGGNGLQYTGRENDQTGLYYYRARYYDPVLKQWISDDPIGLAGGINQRTYVEGDPVSLNDPDGHFANFVGGALFGAGLEVSIQAYKNYRDGCDIFDVSNYDWADVVIAGAVGAIAPGWLNVGKRASSSSRALEALSGQLDRARTVGRAAKVQGRIQQHTASIADGVTVQLSYQALNQTAQAVNGRNRECKCRPGQ